MIHDFEQSETLFNYAYLSTGTIRLEPSEHSGAQKTLAPIRSRDYHVTF